MVIWYKNGTSNPLELTVTARVLTIMLAEEN